MAVIVDFPNVFDRGKLTNTYAHGEHFGTTVQRVPKPLLTLDCGRRQFLAQPTAAAWPRNNVATLVPKQPPGCAPTRQSILLIWRASPYTPLMVQPVDLVRTQSRHRANYRSKQLDRVKLPARFVIPLHVSVPRKAGSKKVTYRKVATYSILALTPAGVEYVPQALRELIESLDYAQLVPNADKRAGASAEAPAGDSGKAIPR
jgi:hypothetical protein